MNKRELDKIRKAEAAAHKKSLLDLYKRGFLACIDDIAKRTDEIIKYIEKENNLERMQITIKFESGCIPAYEIIKEYQPLMTATEKENQKRQVLKKERII